jgi:hypothetical protein
VTVGTDAPQAAGPDCRRSLRGPVGDFSHGKKAVDISHAQIRVTSWGLAMKPVAGRPDAGNPHVRFDERGSETGRLAQLKLSRPSSTLPNGRRTSWRPDPTGLRSSVLDTTNKFLMSWSPFDHQG